MTYLIEGRTAQRSGNLLHLFFVVVLHEIYDLGETGSFHARHLDFQHVVIIVVVVLAIFRISTCILNQIGNLGGRHGNFKDLGIVVLVGHGLEFDHCVVVGIHRGVVMW